jgi:hypothetical protein
MRAINVKGYLNVIEHTACLRGKKREDDEPEKIKPQNGSGSRGRTLRDTLLLPYVLR